MSEKGQLQADPLFLGLTRPAMILGASYMYVLLYMMIVMIIYIQVMSLSVLVWILPLHGIGYLICLKEPRAVELAVTKFGKCMRCKNVRYHGYTNSYDAY